MTAEEIESLKKESLARIESTRGERFAKIRDEFSRKKNLKYQKLHDLIIGLNVLEIYVSLKLCMTLQDSPLAIVTYISDPALMMSNNSYVSFSYGNIIVYIKTTLPWENLQVLDKDDNELINLVNYDIGNALDLI